MLLKIRAKVIDTVFLTLLFFNELSFYTEDTLNLYIGIVGAATIYVGIKIILKPLILKRIVNSRAVIWLTIFYLYIFIDYYLRGFGDFNYLRMTTCWAILIDIWVLIYDKYEYVVIKKYCMACLVAGIVGSSYIIFKDSDSLLSLNRIGESLSGNVNSVGICLSIFSFGILYLYFSKNNKWLLLAFVLVVTMMLLTGSKKVILTLLVEVFLYLSWGGFKFKKTIIAISAAILFVYLIFNNNYLYGILGIRIIDFLGGIGFHISGAHYSFSTRTREDLIKLAWNLFLQKPIFGNGYGAVAKHSAIGFYSHNNMMELLACYGLFGFSLFYSRHLRSLFNLHRAHMDSNLIKFLFFVLINAIIVDVGAVSYVAAGAMPYVFLIVIDAVLTTSKEQNGSDSI